MCPWILARSPQNAVSYLVVTTSQGDSMDPAGRSQGIWKEVA